MCEVIEFEEAKKRLSEKKEKTVGEHTGWWIIAAALAIIMAILATWPPSSSDAVRDKEGACICPPSN